ncbi:MAG TPA: hypothetical protein VM733_14825 [Thermoanaerobaculia bacterium]|nr:hypothetical protein [Thermoanaerobaculia bacterium]
MRTDCWRRNLSAGPHPHTIREGDGSIGDLFQSAGGIRVDAGYDKTGDRKTTDIKGVQTGVLDTSKDKKYRLQYEILFDVETEGVDAVDYYDLVRLAPGTMFLTK